MLYILPRELYFLNSFSPEFTVGFRRINFLAFFFLLHYPQYFRCYEDFASSTYNKQYIMLKATKNEKMIGNDFYFCYVYDEPNM